MYKTICTTRFFFINNPDFGFRLELFSILPISASKVVQWLFIQGFIQVIRYLFIFVQFSRPIQAGGLFSRLFIFSAISAWLFIFWVVYKKKRVNSIIDEIAPFRIFPENWSFFKYFASSQVPGSANNWNRRIVQENSYFHFIRNSFFYKKQSKYHTIWQSSLNFFGTSLPIFLKLCHMLVYHRG